MNSIIKLEHIQKSYIMGKLELKVLKGISLEICGFDGAKRKRQINADEFARVP